MESRLVFIFTWWALGSVYVGCDLYENRGELDTVAILLTVMVFWLIAPKIMLDNIIYSIFNRK